MIVRPLTRLLEAWSKRYLPMALRIILLPSGAGCSVQYLTDRLLAPCRSRSSLFGVFPLPSGKFFNPKAKKWVNVHHSKYLPLSVLPGMTVWHESRLEEKV